MTEITNGTWKMIVYMWICGPVKHGTVEPFIVRCREYLRGSTPLMEASAAGHAISVQFFLQHVSAYVLCLKKNDTDVAHYNFNTHQPLLVILGWDVAERVYYQMVICYPTSPN